jgi:GPH family glycoside/pentoside/hexuronide:cation symporter
LVLGGLVLSFVGFDAGKSIQSLETMNNLRIWDIIIPSLTAGLAIAIMWKYDLSETKAKEIKEELIKRRAELSI